MGRIRTIKPEFFKHETLFDAEAETALPLRLAFAGLWTACDREGRFEWRPRVLKLDVLPHDDLDFSIVLESLEAHGFVVRYEVDGRVYGYIPSWSKHQAINQRESASKIPSPSAQDGNVHARALSAIENEPAAVRLTPDLRATVFAKDGGKCVRCGSTENLTVDHIFPRSLGGTHVLTNLRTLCKSCNSSRPVAGDALVSDLKKDGLTFNDMQRICMHVQTRGEGEGEREGDSSSSSSDAGAQPRDPPPDQAPITNVPDEAWALWRAVLKAAGVPEERLPTYWMPPAAVIHVQRWMGMGLTEQEIIDTARMTRANHTDPPNGPKALDHAMQRTAAAKIMPAFTPPDAQPLRMIGGSNGQRLGAAEKQEKLARIIRAAARGTT